ncbi:glutathione S-transferase family protein [Caballeronia sp. LZ043]|uniref:glutathione S-transferase family protein n=1 Tax=Caballeronia sp. LZ043 TaxID=3038569 RepID=UPI00285B61EA|nr:glutathione S-transferase family protein [Caballeronia sp. LZ043]MDR5821811.1 glutathione S-transferase family protein [Caballeronia sp. LZ043]
MMTLYDHPLSGNCHKVRMLLAMTGLPYRSEFVDVPNEAHHAPWFGDINPLRQIPALDDDGYLVCDSQSILTYLAHRHAPQWLGDTSRTHARVAQWLSFAANEIGNSLQPARLYYLLGEKVDIEAVSAKGKRVLGVLDAYLAQHAWLAADRPTIADLACMPYVGLSREGRLPLDDYPNATAWIERITALPGYVTMKGLPQPAGQRAN